MKVCEYCGTQNEDNEQLCVACGANSFRYICGNCGNEFKDGVFCPKCGVRVGQKPRRCPFCKTDYYSPACPTCGYVPNVPGNDSNIHDKTAYPQKNKNIGLWVLGWIFVPPVALTVLVSKSKKLPHWAKVLIIAAVWIFVFIVAATDADASALLIL